MIIGLTGPNGSGKGTVAKLLAEMGFQVHSLSDVIREELARRGEAPTREALTRMGNALRTRHGPGVLAERIDARLTPEVNHVVDSIRNPAEVEVLRRRHPDFVLVRVDADAALRFARLQARRRVGDVTSHDAFVAQEDREHAPADPAAQQLAATGALADHVVVNDGTVEQLRARIAEVVRQAAARMQRPSWDAYFMDIARVVASRSNCVKRKVAAVIVRDRRVIATGYNGTPRGAPNCNEGGCPRCIALVPPGEALESCLCSHAEENAITQAAYHGVSVKGAVLYSTLSPCLQCTKMIVNAGIAEVVYDARYRLVTQALDLLTTCGVRVRRLGDAGAQGAARDDAPGPSAGRRPG